MTGCTLARRPGVVHLLPISLRVIRPLNPAMRPEHVSLVVMGNDGPVSDFLVTYLRAATELQLQVPAHSAGPPA